MPFRNELDVGWGLAILFFTHAMRQYRYARTARPYEEKPPLLHRVEKYNIKIPCSLTSLACYEWDGSLELRLDGISMPFRNELDVGWGLAKLGCTHARGDGVSNLSEVKPITHNSRCCLDVVCLFVCFQLPLNPFHSLFLSICLFALSSYTQV